jgi:hypothetical protein
MRIQIGIMLLFRKMWMIMDWVVNVMLMEMMMMFRKMWMVMGRVISVIRMQMGMVWSMIETTVPSGDTFYTGKFCRKQFL